MRKIEFSELKLKDISNEEVFYQNYLKNLQNMPDIDTSFNVPAKKYEIFKLNILGGKTILLNTDYISNTDVKDAELYYDYANALKIYNLMLNIEDGIKDEKNESNELYKDERLQYSKEIEQLQKLDNILYKNGLHEYDTIIKSQVYHDYSQLKEENEKIKLENEELKNELKNITLGKSNTNFFRKIINKFKNKRLPEGSQD